jgi:hypothetical protein
MFLMVLCIATSWLLGKNDHYTLKYWFAIIMGCLLLIRIPDFKKKKYHHFFAELCYYVNVLTMIILLTNIDIRYIFPFLHGPLLIYAVFSGDAFIPHSMPRSTSFALHTFGTVVSRRLLWTGDSSMLLNFDDLFAGTYWTYLQTSIIIYLGWFIPYTCYVFWYNGTSMTMLKYAQKLDIKDQVSTGAKVIYLVKHMILTIIAVSIGIILMHNWILDYIVVAIQIISGFVQGGYYYYSGGKKMKIVAALTCSKKNNSKKCS